ncbi:MAG: ABC transporter ATP-binding protein [Candidatus Riflebacteria bacterium]|nr:ABC transporter ATP-binding protein [Candidatus Riflebacteria bacterium]
MSSMTQNPERRHPRRYYLAWIAGQYRGLGWPAAGLFVLTGLSAAAAVLLPLLFSRVLDGLTAGLAAFQAGRLGLDQALAGRNRDLLLLLALGFGPLVGAVYPWVRSLLNLFFERRFRERFVRAALAREPDFFLRFRTGDLVTRLTDNLRNGPSGLPWLCCSGIFRAITAAAVIVSCVAGMFLLHPWLALAAVVPLPLMLLLFWRLQTTMEGRVEAVQEQVSETTAFLEATFTGIRILKAFTAEEPQRSGFAGLLTRRQGHEFEQARTEGLFQIYFEFLTYLGEILVLVGGGVLVARGALSLGAYYAFFGYLGMILPTVMDIPMLLVTLSQACVIIDRLEEVEGSGSAAAVTGAAVPGCEARFPAPEPTTGAPGAIPALPAGGASLHRPFTELAFRDVRFAYPEPAGEGRHAFRLQGVSFTVRRGEKVAVVGPIGAGKSTVLHLAAGLLDPAAGEILVDGWPLAGLDRRAWRERIGLVQQEPVVFSETVRGNIDFWRGLGEERVVWATELAQVREEIERLPGGFGERLGPRGTGLSGGQKQRLSLARALAGRPELLLMDDVTAGLDAANERRLWRRLRAAAPDLTCLIVTHRAATARVADRIVVLDRGRVLGVGSHADLQRTCPLYRELSSSGPTSQAPARLAA